MRRLLKKLPKSTKKVPTSIKKVPPKDKEGQQIQKKIKNILPQKDKRITQKV